jgi:hypothetical protein
MRPRSNASARERPQRLPCLVVPALVNNDQFKVRMRVCQDRRHGIYRQSTAIACADERRYQRGIILSGNSSHPSPSHQSSVRPPQNRLPERSGRLGWR